MSFLNPLRKKSEEVRVGEIRFLGEQDGPPERLLKEKLADFFRRDGSVSRAYLAKVDFGTVYKHLAAILVKLLNAASDEPSDDELVKLFPSTFS